MDMKKGFTLVELSIALVVIGLLIAGVLVGQSIIQGAKINRLVGDFGQYEVAVKQFYLKFKQLPGDSNLMAAPGDNNGYFDQGYDCEGAYSNKEQYQFWGHLSKTNMLSTRFELWSPTTCGGSHSTDPTNASQYGLLYPYYKLNSEDVAKIPSSYISGNKSAFIPAKGISGSLEINLYVGALEMLSLENKMGASDYAYSTSCAGFTNRYGVGQCPDGGEYSSTGCTAADAKWGDATYCIDPRK